MDSQTLPYPGAIQSLFDLHQEEAYQSHVNIYEVRIKMSTKGWLCILKATRRHSWVVAFIGGRNFGGALANLAKLIENHDVEWRLDEYPPDWRRKLGNGSL